MSKLINFVNSFYSSFDPSLTRHDYLLRYVCVCGVGVGGGWGWWWGHYL